MEELQCLEGFFFNPVMRNAAPLIILEYPIYQKNCSSRHHKAIRTGKVDSKMSLLSAPGSVLIKTTLMKSLAECCSAPHCVLVKASTCKSDSWSLYTSKVICYYNQHLLDQRDLHAWLVLFLDNMLLFQQ